MRFKIDPMESIVGSVLLIIITVLMTVEVIFRYIFGFSIIWSEELSRYFFIWFVYISASYAVYDNSHIRIDSIMNLFPDKVSYILKNIGIFVWVIINAYICYLSFRYSIEMLNRQVVSSETGILTGIVYLGIPLGFGLMVIRLLLLLLKDIFAKRIEGK